MNFKEAKDLLSFMKSCRKLGIKDFKNSEISFSFQEASRNSVVELEDLKPLKVSRQASRAADAIERTEKIKTEQDIREEEHASLLVEHPEDFETSMIEELSDDTRSEDTDSE